MDTQKRFDQVLPAVGLDHLQAVSRLLEEAKQELTRCRLPGAADLEIGSNLMTAAERIRLELNRRAIRNRVLAREKTEEYIRSGGLAGSSCVS